MAKITVKSINFDAKELELEKPTVNELIKLLGTNDDAVIFVDENGDIRTKDSRLSDGTVLDMIEVFSGG